MEETGHTTQENTIETSSILTEESHRKSTFAKRFRKGLRILVVLLLLALGGYIYVHYFYVFGSGVKTGTLNYVVKKGYIFKTYEGELIMTGLQSKVPVTIQSINLSFLSIMTKWQKN